MRDHRTRHPDTQKEDTTLVYLAVDDLTSLTEYPDTLKAITNALGESSISAPSHSFFVPLLTGTNDVAVTEALRSSSHPKTPVPVPFLPYDDVHSMIDESGFDSSTLNVAQTQELEGLILDIAGLPRGVEQLIVSLCERQGEENVVSRARIEIELFFRRRYGIGSCREFEHLVIMSILRLPVTKEEPVRLTGNDDSIGLNTYGDLEINGGVLLSPERAMFQVVVPMIQVKAYLQANTTRTRPLANYLRPVLDSMYSIKSWRDWEKFNVGHHALLNYCWSVNSGKVLLDEFYKGAMITDDFSQCSLVLPKDGDYSCFDAPNGKQFPSINENYPVEKFLPGRVMSNVCNAPGPDGLTISYTTAGSWCARLLCMAHTMGGGTDLDNNKADSDISKARLEIGRYLTNEEIRRGQQNPSLLVSVILSNRELPSSFQPPKNSIVVSHKQMTGFYGCSFAPHLQARVRHTRYICTLASSPLTPLTTPLSTCFRAGLWTIKHL